MARVLWLSMALLSALTVVGQEAPTVDFEPGSGFYRERVTVELRAPGADAIVINEVCPKSKSTGDWLELYNRGDSTADLRDWILTDHRHEFRLPGVQLAAGGYLVLPEMDNALVRNWHLYPGHGTPARANPYFLSTYVQSNQRYWLRYGVAIGFVLLALFWMQWRQKAKRRTGG